MEHDEATLVARAQAGERAAFTHLVELYWDRVYRWLYGMTHDRQVAEDLGQEAFLKAWSALGGLQQAKSFRPWLFRIVRHAWTDWQRARRVLERPLPDEVAGAACPVQELIFREGEGLLQQALTRLPDGLRAAFLLWTQEELPYSAIAEVLDTTEETARWRVCKARRLLLQQLEPYLDRNPT